MVISLYRRQRQYSTCADCRQHNEIGRISENYSKVKNAWEKLIFLSLSITLCKSHKMKNWKIFITYMKLGMSGSEAVDKWRKLWPMLLLLNQRNKFWLWDASGFLSCQQKLVIDTQGNEMGPAWYSLFWLFIQYFLMKQLN